MPGGSPGVVLAPGAAAGGEQRVGAGVTLGDLGTAASP